MLFYSLFFSGLAISDFSFCGATLLCIHMVQDKMFFKENGVSLFFTVYEAYFQNLFIKTSTGIIVIMTLYRHLAIAFPFSSKQYLTARNALFAVVACFTFWILFLLPLLWTWQIDEWYCPNGDPYYVLDIGPFEDNETMRKVLTHSWSVMGFIVPVCVLGYCNIRLILSLRNTMHGSGKSSVAQTTRQQHRMAAQRLMTITLITILASYFLLAFPSEGFAYFMDFTTEQQNNYMLNIVQVTCNALQAINMSINFILYCVVNSNFRRTMQSMLPKCPGTKNNNDYNSIPLTRHETQHNTTTVDL